MSPYKHTLSSIKEWGGSYDDYYEIHEFLDSTKLHYDDLRHRSILHNTFGIGICEKLFGSFITNTDGKNVEVRYIAQKHIQEDLGFVPTLKDWCGNIVVKDWMSGKYETITKTIEV